MRSHRTQTIVKTDSLGVVYQFTDCHVFDPKFNIHYKKIDTNASLLACLQGAKQIGTPDLLVFSGDLSHDKSIASYRFLAENIIKFFPTTPSYIQSGNHDDLNAMKQVFPYQNCTMKTHFRFGRWLIYLLETEALEGGWFHARISPPVYNDLKQISQDKTISDVLVFMHYNLVNLKFRDIQCGITETDQLRQAMLNTGKVRCVSSGHIHQEYHWLDRGIIYTSTPTTGFQSHLANGKESDEKIGFKRFEIFSDGSVSMDTQRICSPIKGVSVKV